MGIGEISIWQLIIVVLLISTALIFPWKNTRASPPNSVNAMWKSLGYLEATRHPLYGIEGWAFFLWLSLVIFSPGMLVGYYVYVGSFIDQYPSPDDLNNFMLLGVFLNTMASWFLGYKLWTKESNFQALFTWVCVGSFLVHQVILLPYELTLYPTLMREGLSEKAFSNIFKVIVPMMVWIIYVWRSKRINVTCVHRVKANDAFFIELMYAKSRRQTDAKSEITPRSSVVVKAQPDQSAVEAAQTVKTETKPAQDNPNKKSLPERSKEPIDDSADELYAIAWDEVEAKNTDTGLWARLYVEHNGDEGKTRVAYLKERVAQLTEEQNILKKQEEAKEKIELSPELARFVEKLIQNDYENYPAFVDIPLAARSSRLINCIQNGLWPQFLEYLANGANPKHWATDKVLPLDYARKGVNKDFIEALEFAIELWDRKLLDERGIYHSVLKSIDTSKYK